MFLEVLLFILLFDLGAVHGNPVRRGTGKAVLTFSAKIDATGFPNLVEKDRARALALTRLPHLAGRAASNTLNVTNAAVYYTAEVGVGTPPTNYTLLIDTGSSNTWVGASKQYTPTNSSVDTGGIVTVVYGSGAFSGQEWLDTVTLNPSLVVEHQSIGVARWTRGIDGFDGILGLGPVDLTQGTTSNAFQVPTVLDNLYMQRAISQEVVGIFFKPTCKPDGQLVFGGYDDSVMTSAVNYTTLTTTFPASEFWGIEQSVSYGGTTILSSSAGIVDTGTTFILLATDAFHQYQSLTGATLDSSTGLLTITSSQYADLKTLSFHIGGNTYDLIPNAQIWPRSLNHVVGGTSSAIYLVIVDIGLEDRLAFDFINGYTFLERFYSVFDTTGQRFGIARTTYTDAEVN